MRDLRKEKNFLRKELKEKNVSLRFSPSAVYQIGDGFFLTDEKYIKAKYKEFVLIVENVTRRKNVDTNNLFLRVFDTETNTYIFPTVDFKDKKSKKDIFVALLKIKDFTSELDNYILLKEQAKKIRGIVEEGKVLLVSRKFNDLINLISISQVSGKYEFKIYENIEKSLIKDFKPIEEIMKSFKTYVYVGPDRNKFISEVCSLIPQKFNEIKEPCDLNKEFVDFVNSPEDILILKL